MKQHHSQFKQKHVEFCATHAELYHERQQAEIVKSNKSMMLSDRDRDTFLEILENPPKANKNLKKAIREYKLNHA